VRVLTVNCGSSSLKFDIVDVLEGKTDRVARGATERIGPQSEVWLQAGENRTEWEAGVSDYAGAVATSMALLRDAGLLEGLDVVAHRVVHGGPRFRDAVIINGDVMQAIEAATELAPLHNGPALEAIRAARKLFGEAMPMVAAFDTAFFGDLPPVAREYALPKDIRERLQIRRYGFHGLAHRYMIERYGELRPKVKTPRLITLQLGSGCSITASRAGRPLDTSMGHTPIEGLIMGTRSGDLDPMLPLLVAEQAGMTTDQVEELLNKQSGLLGLSGVSNDMRELQKAASDGNEAAALAIDAFCYRARKYIGAYQAVLSGCDAIVFGGGIGERSPEVRRAICEPLGWCGVNLDRQRNSTATEIDAFITTAGSTNEVLVVHVDEASGMAKDAARVMHLA
jgi:acetate kinase